MSGGEIPERSLAGRRVLVVEDEYFIAMDVSSALIDAGANVIGPAVSVAGAIDLVGSEYLDAAVLDIGLPDGNAFPLVDLLGLKAVPVVFATAYDCRSLPEPYRKMPCLEKPFEYRALVSAIASSMIPLSRLIRPAET